MKLENSLHNFVALYQGKNLALGQLFKKKL